MIGRRAVFFAVAAVVCAALVPLSEHKLRWVPIAVAITYVVLALLSALDAISRYHETTGSTDDADRAGGS